MVFNQTPQNDIYLQNQLGNGAFGKCATKERLKLRGQ